MCRPTRGHTRSAHHGSAGGSSDAVNEYQLHSKGSPREPSLGGYGLSNKPRDEEERRDDGRDPHQAGGTAMGHGAGEEEERMISEVVTGSSGQAVVTRAEAARCCPVGAAHDRSRDPAGARDDHRPARSSTQPPDGGYGWTVVGGVAVAFFVAGGLSRSFTLIYQSLLIKFGGTAAATSTVAAIFGTVKMCSSPFVSLLCEKFGQRSMAVVGGLLAGVSLLASAFPPSLMYLYISYGVFAAFGFNLVLTPSFVIIGRYFKKQKGKAMALAMLGGSLGGICLPPLVHFLFSYYGYTGCMLILSSCTLNLCITGALFRPLTSLREARKTAKNASPVTLPSPAATHVTVSDKPQRNKRDADLGLSAHAPAHAQSSAAMGVRAAELVREQRERKVSFSLPEETPATREARGDDNCPLKSDNTVSRSQRVAAKRAALMSRQTPDQKRHSFFFIASGLPLLKRSRFLCFSALMVGSIFSLSITGTFISGLVGELGSDVSRTALLLSASGAADIPSKFISGFVFDHERLRDYRSIPLAILGLLSGAFILTMGVCESYTELFIMYMLYTFFTSAYHTQHATVLSDLVESRSLSSAMGLCRLFQGVGFLIGPTVGGYIRDAYGSYRPAYYLSGCVLLASTLAFLVTELWALRTNRQTWRPGSSSDGVEIRYRQDSISTV